MNAVVYEFEKLDISKQGGYIFQHVKDRKLTSVYHSHDFYELLWFGCKEAVSCVNGKDEKFYENDVLMLRPGDSHCFISQSDGAEVVSVSVKAQELRGFLGVYDPMLLKYLDMSPVPVRCRASDTVSTDGLISGIDTGRVQDLRLLLAYFSSFLSKSVELENKKKGFAFELFDTVSESELKEGIPAFVRLSHYSQSHLSRLVRARCGKSLKSYVNELRLEYAYGEIVMTSRDVKDVAESVGFLSFSHFCKIFKMRFSVSPSALRKSKAFWTV